MIGLLAGIAGSIAASQLAGSAGEKTKARNYELPDGSSPMPAPILPPDVMSPSGDPYMDLGSVMDGLASKAGRGASQSAAGGGLQSAAGNFGGAMSDAYVDNAVGGALGGIGGALANAGVKALGGVIGNAMQDSPEQSSAPYQMPNSRSPWMDQIISQYLRR